MWLFNTLVRNFSSSFMQSLRPEMDSVFETEHSVNVMGRPVVPLNLDSKDKVDFLLRNYDYILTDCDGVLYVNNDAVPGVPAVLNRLRDMGKKIIFATNNSTKSRKEFQKKLNRLGYESYMDELFPTSYSTAAYLQSQGFKKKVYVFGMSGIGEELDLVGIPHIGVGKDVTPSDWAPGQCDVTLDPDVGAVVVGFDNQLSFAKLARAASYVGKGCAFIASNTDETFPHHDKSIFVPGPGAQIAAIERMTGKEAIALGKPYKFFFDIIRNKHPDIDPKRTIMIGDRLTTDMVFGRNNGLATLFVQSGLGTLQELNNYRNSTSASDQRCVPDFYLSSLAALHKHIR